MPGPLSHGATRRGFTVLGSTELPFGLDFEDKLVDDFRLGFRSGKKADIVIIDQERYVKWIGMLEEVEPEAYLSIRGMIKRDFHMVYSQRKYAVYEREK